MKHTFRSNDKETRFDTAAEAILHETDPDAFRKLSTELYVTYNASNPDIAESIRTVRDARSKGRVRRVDLVVFPRTGRTRKRLLFPVGHSYPAAG